VRVSVPTESELGAGDWSRTSTTGSSVSAHKDRANCSLRRGAGSCLDRKTKVTTWGGRAGFSLTALSKFISVAPGDGTPKLHPDLSLPVVEPPRPLRRA